MFILKTLTHSCHNLAPTIGRTSSFRDQELVFNLGVVCDGFTDDEWCFFVLVAQASSPKNQHQCFESTHFWNAKLICLVLDTILLIVLSTQNTTLVHKILCHNILKLRTWELMRNPRSTFILLVYYLSNQCSIKSFSMLVIGGKK